MFNEKELVIRLTTTEANPSEFWATLRKIKDAKGKEKYKDLCDFMLTLCGLPHSSAAAERQFSILSNIKTKLRNRL